MYNVQPIFIYKYGMSSYSSSFLTEKVKLFSCEGGLRHPAPPLKVGRIRGLRNDGPVHGPWPGPMALAHWARVRPRSMCPWTRAWVRPWSMGPGPGPWPWPIGRVRPWSMGPGLGPVRWLAGRLKKKFKLFSGVHQEVPEEFPNGLRVRYPCAH